MPRVALLIGVGQDTDASPQPSVGVQQNIESMKRVLQNREIGRFEVKTLTNPDRISMEQGVAALFANCQKYDLVLLYFSGLALKNARGELYLTAGKSNSTAQETASSLPALAASFIQAMSAKSQSERQVVILDCCLHNAAGEPGDNNFVNAATQLVREGQAALAAFTPPYCQHNRPQPSVYTRYLVEGMETGAADLDNDGVVSVDELHEYTSRKVRKVAPGIESIIYWVRADANKLVLAKAATGDPKLSYRKQVERLAWAAGSAENRRTLDALRERLNLPLEEASAIEARVLQPDQEYRQQSKHRHSKPENLHKPLQHSKSSKFGELVGGLKQTNALPLETTGQKGLVPFLSRVPRSNTIVIPNEAATKPANPVTARAVRPVFARLWDTNPAIREPRLRLLIGTAIAAILMLIALVSRLPLTKPTPPTRSENPSQEIKPEATIPVPSASQPLPLLTPTPLVQPPPEPLMPASTPETPAFSLPDLPLVVPQARPTSAPPQSPSPLPKVATPKPKATLAPPQWMMPDKPPTLQAEPSPASEPTPILVEPEAPPTLQIEAPPSSEPGATLSDPEAPPEAGFEPPPTSAPEPSF